MYRLEHPDLGNPVLTYSKRFLASWVFILWWSRVTPTIHQLGEDGKPIQELDPYTLEPKEVLE